MAEQTISNALFRRSLENIDESYIDGIKDLEEGWFVEFKIRCPDTDKIARSISSFANAHGGLLIIGVEEDDKTRRFKNFSPMSRQAADETLTKIRQAADAHIQPCPFFEFKAAAIDETIDQWIVLVRVPKGEHPPYLHSSGVVYTRKGDSSAPARLTDLGLFDRLWSESKQRRQSTARRIEFLCEQSKSKVPRIELVIHDATEGREIKDDVSFEKFRSIALTPVSSGGVPLLSTVHTIDRGYIARMAGEVFGAMETFWEYDERHRLHFICLPLSSRHWREGAFLNADPKYWPLQPLANYLDANHRHSKKDILVLDLSPMMYILSAIIYMVNQLYINGNYQLRYNFRASSVRFGVPYIELPRFKNFLETGNLPYIHRNIDFFRPLDEPDSWPKFHVFDSGENGEPPTLSNLNLDLGNSTFMFILIARSLGIPDSIIYADGSQNGDFTEFSQLFGRLASESFSFSSVENSEAD
jgi:hypothetical protein